MDKRLAQAIYGSFKRLGNFPIDPSSYFEKWSNLDDYLKNDRTAYPGQLLVVYADDVDKNGLYISFEAADKSFKASRVSQSEELNSKIDNLLESLEALEKNVNDSIENQDKNIEEKFIEQNKIIESIQKEYATKEDLYNEIDALLGFEVPDNLDEVLNTFKEIDDWVKGHEEDLEKYKAELEATHDLIDEKIEAIGDIHQKNIDALKDRTYFLEGRVSALEAGVIKNVLQTISLDIDSDPSNNVSGYYSESISFNKLIPSGYVIQSLRVVTSDNISELADYENFSVYLALDGTMYKELIEGKSYYPEIDDEPTLNISFKNPGESYIFDTDYEIPFIGVDTYGTEITRNFELKVDISGPARCKGKLYINYFKKV